MPFVCRVYVLVCHQYAIYMSLLCNSMLSVYVLKCHSYVTRIYPCVLCMSLACSHIVILCHLYVLVYHRYITRIYSYAIRTLLVGTCMSPVCHSYVTVCHSFITGMCFYHERCFNFYLWLISHNFVCS